MELVCHEENNCTVDTVENSGHPKLLESAIDRIRWRDRSWLNPDRGDEATKKIAWRIVREMEPLKPLSDDGTAASRKLRWYSVAFGG